jgi:hypothetical protein
LLETHISSSSLEQLTAYLTYALYLNQNSFWLLATHQEVAPSTRLEGLFSTLNQVLKAEDPEYTLKSKQSINPLSFPGWEARLAKLPKETLNEIRLVGELNDPYVWIQSVEQTAYRLALILSGSLEAVLHLMKTVPSPSQDPLEDRLYKLLLFAVSRPYLELRQNLGLNLHLQL